MKPAARKIVDWILIAGAAIFFFAVTVFVIGLLIDVASSILR